MMGTCSVQSCSWCIPEMCPAAKSAGSLAASLGSSSFAAWSSAILYSRHLSCASTRVHTGSAAAKFWVHAKQQIRMEGGREGHTSANVKIRFRSTMSRVNRHPSNWETLG